MAEGQYCASAQCMQSWKIGFAVILFVEGLVFGFLVLLLRRLACLGTVRFRKFLSFVNVAGGGVFLATGLLHILPETVELLKESEGHNAEEVHSETGAAPDVHAEEAAVVSEIHGEHGHGEFPLAFALALGVFIVFLLLDHVLFSHSAQNEQKVSRDEEEALENVDPIHDQHNGLFSAAFATVAVATLGISAHSILESLALGGSSSWGTMLNAFIAISTHRWATSMALGSRYARANLNTLSYSILTVAFAFVSPLGVAIGAGIREASPKFIGVIFALSAGTFLYIGAFESLAEEFVEHHDDQLAKFFIFTAAAGLITAITGILSAAGVH